MVGSDADLAAVLTRLLRADRLDVEVGHGTMVGAGRARRGTARRVPLIRDETGHVIVGSAEWRGEDGAPLHGEAVVDDTQLFDGEVAGVRVEPTPAMPGLRASVTGPGRRRWVAGRAAQLGTTGRGGGARRHRRRENRSPIYVLSPHRGLAAGEIGPVRIIVTGGNSGVGRETATALAAEGHSVLIAARTSRSPSRPPPRWRATSRWLTSISPT